jgi:hypothetical protein
VPALHVVPTEVGAHGDGARDVVDLLPRALADVADVEVAVGAVEAEPERVPETLAPGRDRIGIDVDAQQLAEPARVVLRVVAGVPAAAAVSRRGIEETVGAEVQVATVVIAKVGWGNGDDDVLRRFERVVGIAGIRLEARDSRGRPRCSRSRRRRSGFVS